MTGSRSWMIAGTLAGLLFARAHRAAQDDDPAAASARGTMEVPAQSGEAPWGAAPSGGARDGTGSAGAGAGETRREWTGGDSDAQGRAPGRQTVDQSSRGDDADEVAAGNTGGRG